MTEEPALLRDLSDTEALAIFRTTAFLHIAAPRSTKPRKPKT